MAIATNADSGPAEYLTVAETARLFRVSEVTVRRMARRGELPALRFGAQWRIERDGLASPARIRPQPETRTLTCRSKATGSNSSRRRRSACCEMCGAGPMPGRMDYVAFNNKSGDDFAPGLIQTVDEQPAWTAYRGRDATASGDTT